jgi:hypothetical protein
VAASYRDARDIGREEFAPERARLFERACELSEANRERLPVELRSDLAHLTARLAAVDAGLDLRRARAIAAAYEETLEAALATPPPLVPRPRAPRFDWPVLVATAVAVVTVLLWTV